MNQHLRIERLDPLHKPLLARFYRANGGRLRGVSGGSYWVAREMALVGALTLSPVAGGTWVTGLLVAPEARGRGIGSRLVRQATAGTGGPVWLFCEPTLLDFYAPLGFECATDLPAELSARLIRYRASKRLIALGYAHRNEDSNR